MRCSQEARETVAKINARLDEVDSTHGKKLEALKQELLDVRDQLQDRERQLKDQEMNLQDQLQEKDDNLQARSGSLLRCQDFSLCRVASYRQMPLHTLQSFRVLYL